MSLPRLIDCAGIVQELGVKKHLAERAMRQCRLVRIPGSRRVFVYRAELERRLAEWTQETT